MITVTNRRDTKSFTDETSPRQLTKSDRKVSITGQVIREEGTKWFRDLVKLCPVESVEVKSVRILDFFHTCPRDFQDRVWLGIKRVRINIVDSLPYQLNFKKIFDQVWKGSRIWKLIESDAQRHHELAKLVKKHFDERVTERIVRDSTPYRLRELMRPKYAPYSLSYYLPENRRKYELESVRLDPFRKKRASMTGTAVKYVAKAASVFNPAIDAVSPMTVYFGDTYHQYRVQQLLHDSHAFDEGDDSSVKWIRDQRQQVSSDDWAPFPEDDGWITDGYVDDCGEYGELYCVPSHENEYVQAADIAAGFARQNYERYGIAAVADKFEHVTINGERITHDNAEERFEYWRQLFERHAKHNRSTSE